MKQTAKRSLSLITAMLMVFSVFLGMSPFALTAFAAEERTPFAIDYDPNDGMIKYGHSGEIGMRPENDTNNNFYKHDKVVYFPSDMITLRDENNDLVFPDYDPDDPYYDYSDMLNKALEVARAEHDPRDSTNCAQVFVEEGVYYFKKSIYLWGYTDINGVAGKSVFVVEPNLKDADGNPVDANGFFTNKNLSETYSWYFGNISDLTFVVNGAHDSFKPTSTPEQILNNICSDQVNPHESYSLFYRVRMAYGGLSNLAVSGFQCFMRWTFTDMLSRVKDITCGPCRIALYGVQTNDAFYYDNYFYGGYYVNEDGYERLPVFQLNFSMGTTLFSNSYIGNFLFTRTGAGCWCPHASYSNLTLERVYNFAIDTTVDSNSVSGCLFKDCSYNDIAEYFESMSIQPYDHETRYWDATQKKWMFPGKGYIIHETYLNDYRAGGNHRNGTCIPMIRLHGGGTFSQNKIECDSLEWTTLVELNNSEWVASYSGKRTGSQNVYFTDNAFKIKDWKYENLMIDDWKQGHPYTEGWEDYTVVIWGEKGWNNSDGTPAMGGIGVRGDKPVSWLDDGVYISPEFCRYVDLSAFLDPNKETAGYAELGKVGADEQQLWNMGLEQRYSKDLNDPNIEKVYFEEDFGGMSWNPGSNYEKLQSAFDYVATHVAILYIDPGTYYTDKPIVLRGGATYRVFFNGTIRSQRTADMDGKGIFVMSADDNAPINGYFLNTSLYMQNCNAGGFYNVNFDKFAFTFWSVARGTGCFVNCRINNSVMSDGSIQYCDYGFFYKTVTDNLLIKNVYGTASTWEEGADGITPGDLNYRYFISNSDFKNSTWRACWLEFGQFSNGKKLLGDGNSVYRGNIIDYTYNYSFGKNDVFVGNTLTRGGRGSIVNHMLNSNFPIDLPDALTDKPMVFYHISDGLRLIGNAQLGTMTYESNCIQFDSPTIRYVDDEGNEYTSISDARIAGNMFNTVDSGDYKVNYPITPYDVADDIVLQNCKNNEFMLHTLYFNDQADDPATALDETITVTKNDVTSWSLPHLITYVNGERLEVNYPAQPEKDLEQDTTDPDTQDDIFDVPNIWITNVSNTEFLLYDFKDRTPEQKTALEALFDSYIDVSTASVYLNSRFNTAIMPNEITARALSYSEFKALTAEQKLEVMTQILHHEIAQSPSGNDAYFTDQSRDENYGAQNNANRPTFALAFDADKISGEALQGVTASVYYDTHYSTAWQGKRNLMFILSEDDDYYYGIALGYGQMNYGLITGSCKIRKDYMEYFTSDASHRNFCQAHFEYGAEFNAGNAWQLSHYDPFGNITRPYNGEQQKTVFGDYTTIPMFEDIADLGGYESRVLGFDIVFEYNDAYDSVSAYATVDFSEIGVDTSEDPALKATTRKVWLGTYDLEGRDKVFGMWSGDRLWIESVQFEYVPDALSQCAHNFTETITREGHCTKDTVVRHTCSLCGYEYEDTIAAKGHSFVDRIRNTDGKTIRHCRICGFEYASDFLPENLCDHEYTMTVIQEDTCRTEGAVVYECSDCGDVYTEKIDTIKHNYTTRVIFPTKTEQGYTLHTCTHCGDNYKDNYTNYTGGSSSGSGGSSSSGVSGGSGSSDGSHDSGGFVSSGVPSIDGVNYNWYLIATMIEKLSPDEKLTVKLNGCTNVPYFVFEALAKSEGIIDLVEGSLITWRIDGENIDEATDAYLNSTYPVKMDTSALNGKKEQVFRITSDTNAPTAFVYTFGKDDAGCVASVYRKSSDGTAEFMERVKVNEDGTAAFNLSQSGDYALMISNALIGDANNDGMLTPRDCAIILRAFVGLESVIDSTILDYNGDGVISPRDAAVMLYDLVYDKV